MATQPVLAEQPRREPSRTVRVVVSTLGKPVAGYPLPVWGVVGSCFAMIVGWNWDISWHRSIGRDTVWTPAHVAIYVALLAAFVACAGLVISHTFGPQRAAPGVRLLGFKGPSGAFIALWALFLQFSAILFDNWWHEAYGLDVGVFSPPHGILGIGITVYYLAHLEIAALHRNLAPPGEQGRATIPVVAIGGMFLAHMALTADPHFGPAGMLTTWYVATSALAFPFGLALIGAYVGKRWASIVSAAVYVVLLLALIQIFQLFPATPRFGPVFHRLGFLLPPPFPMLLVVPAAALELVLPSSGGRYGLGRHLLAGAAFVLAFNLSNAALAGFLSTPAAANPFFTGGYPGSVFEPDYRVGIPFAFDARGAAAVAVGCCAATLTSWLGRRGGLWLREVMR